MKPLVAIVGRPNVGKSTLFNRLIGRRKAITRSEPGVTRDLNYGDVSEGGRTFTLVDTGGFEPEAAGGIMGKVKEQMRLAVEEADLVIFLMDGREGLTAADRELVDMLRKTHRPVIYAVNKVDSPRLEGALAEFYDLGVDRVMAVSAERGDGVYELLEEVMAALPVRRGKDRDEAVTKVAIVGRPNAGKSSILNRLAGRERMIVSEVPGTTRDAVDTEIRHHGRRFVIVDTAGIRKKSRVSSRLENYAVMAAIRSVESCDVALLVIDALEGVKSQDAKVGSLIAERGKPALIVINKWDLVDKDSHTMARYEREVRAALPGLGFAPIIFVSALTGRRTGAILDAVSSLDEAASRRVPTARLNEVFAGITARKRPPVYRGRQVKLYYITQSGVRPPTFVVFANYPAGVAEHYRRYLVNRLRELLDLGEVPVRLHFRMRK
ncbi:MAG TPA: ribosome biogenesis GTPase Der [Deltaproteobacteria bacterium]|nr:ribosome biogenesis GTPase Der [Deltaproteobacteria bacterium]